MLERTPAAPIPSDGSTGAAAPHPAVATCRSGQAGTLLPLVVEGLSLTIEGHRLIDSIDLHLDATHLTVIVGPNGAGKSLLLRLLHGLVPPSAGRIAWAGQPPDEATRKRQAMVFQRPVLLRRSVAANIDFVLGLRRRADHARRDAILDRVGLLGHAAQPARLLSGGEQQRLVMARALATEPAVLLLDEPTASLDPASTQAIEDITAAIHAAGTKVILVTHDMGQARRLAGEIVFLHRGRLVEHRPAAAFFDAPASEVAAAYLAGRIVL